MEHSDSAASTAPPPLQGYELLDKIGEGGMGEVYRAVQLSLQRTVAVKFLNPTPHEAAGPALQHEARVMASLAHPHVVTIYDCGRIDDRKYLVMELVKGAALRARMKPGQPWSIAEAVAVLNAIAAALSYIHGQGVLHLDLKPENVLCSEDGTVKVSDFGLALPSRDAQTLAAGRLYQGTIDYCAPEQRFGLALDVRCDIFSLATLAYELLTGRLPGRVYVPASQRNPRLPAALDAVLERGLAREPKDRYASVEEFRTALAAALRPRRHSPLLVGLLGATTVAAIAGVALLWHHWNQTEPPAAGPEDTVPAISLRCWLLADRPEKMHWLTGAGNGDFRADPSVQVQRVTVSGAGPWPQLNLPVSMWPLPQPVVLLAGSKTLGFVYPLMDTELAERIVQQWPRLVEWRVPLSENLVQAGGFDGDCLSPTPRGSVWRITSTLQPQRRFIALGIPADQPGNPALMLQNEDAAQAGNRLSCYQPLKPMSSGGSVLVLRYRARAESGDGNLTLAPELPLLVPPEDHSSAADRVRARSAAMPPDSGDKEPNRWRYSLQGWVKPSSDWLTYYVIWEQPSFTVRPVHRVLRIWYTGIGKVWVDDVELFAWEPGKTP